MPPQVVTTSRHATATAASSGSRPAIHVGRPEIVEVLRSDPLFQVFTVDRLHWIEPFRCQLVDIGFDGQEAMIRWLQEHPQWVTAPRKSLRVLRCLRWYYWLRETLMREPRLRYFDQLSGQWLNPFSGAWQPAVCRKGPQLNREVLQAMAQALVDCPAAAVAATASDPAKHLLPRCSLDQLLTGGDPMATAELPIYHRPAPPVARPVTGAVARQDSGAFSTQDLSSLGRSLAAAPESDPAAHRWHAVIDGNECAAVSWTHLCTLASRGRLHAHTLLRPEGGSQYLAAERCAGLPLIAGLAPATTTRLARPAVAKPAGGAGGEEARSVTAALAAMGGNGLQSQRWVVQIKPHEQLMVNAKDLRRLVSDGRITPTTMLRRDDMEYAVPAAKVRGLFG